MRKKYPLHNLTNTVYKELWGIEHCAEACEQSTRESPQNLRAKASRCEQKGARTAFHSTRTNLENQSDIPFCFFQIFQCEITYNRAVSRGAARYYTYMRESIAYSRQFAERKKAQ